ncbi:MAG: sugar phosphate isomerase/epimerase family protein [Desulfobaccales bacterium]|nr:sugar phosphate isomerase/epimerase family protein [Desulfobaccales bacterium]
MPITIEALVDQVLVNVPFAFLVDRYLPRFLEAGLNPEIGLDAFSLESYPQATFEKIARPFKEAGCLITLHAPFQDLLPGALDEGVRAASLNRLRQAFRLLPVFQPVAIVCHLGYEARHYQWERQEWLARSAPTWKELAQIAADHQVTVMLENVYETEPELVLELINRIKAPNLKACLDVGHLLSFGGGDFPHWLKTLAPVIGHLHLHDNHGDADDHLALGAGKVPLEYVLNFLAARDLKPLITLEPHQEGSLNPSLKHLARIWPWE